MPILKTEFPILFFTFLFMVCLSPAYCRPKGPPSIGFLRSEEAGRLRRGFQTSSLATARGFGKRSNAGTIPFVNIEPVEVMNHFPEGSGRRFGYVETTIDRFQNKGRSYPVAMVVDMIRTNQALANAIVERYVDLDGDGLISIEELERLQ